MYTQAFFRMFGCCWHVVTVDPQTNKKKAGTKTVLYPQANERLFVVGSFFEGCPGLRRARRRARRSQALLGAILYTYIIRYT